MTTTAPIKQPLTIVNVQERLVALKHCTCTQDELKDTLGSAFGEIYARIGHSGVATAGPPFVVYNDASVPGQKWDIDVCAPIAEAISPTSDVSVRTFPAEKVVEVLHIGPYESLGVAYQRINEFIAQEGLARTGPPREIYLSEPDVPADRIQTVIEQPIS